jgi:hypothetical protein
MAATRKQRIWGKLTDLIAMRGNAGDAVGRADDAFRRIAAHSRDPAVHQEVQRGRAETAQAQAHLERQRRGLIEVRDDIEREGLD